MGGGGGGSTVPAPGSPNVLTPWAGGGNGDTITAPGDPIKSSLVNGLPGTGGGGGGGHGTDATNYPWAESYNGSGGSGLVLIAYPT